jgi:nicotinamide N-methyltransferase
MFRGFMKNKNSRQKNKNNTNFHSSLLSLCLCFACLDINQHKNSEQQIETVRFFVVKIFIQQMMEEEMIGDFSPLFGASKCQNYVMKTNGKSLVAYTRKRDTVVLDSSDEPKLFIDNIWPGSFVLSDYLQLHSELCRDKNVIELGAGTALPSLVASYLNASWVLVTDYPDNSVIQNLQEVIEANKTTHNTTVCSHEWGSSISGLFTCLNDTRLFDLILVAEPLWKDTYPLHKQLLSSIKRLLASDGKALITFAHRPTTNHCPANDLEFFTRGRSEFALEWTYIGADSSYRDAQEDEDFIEVHIYCMTHCVAEAEKQIVDVPL